MREILRSAYVECSDRGLLNASKLYSLHLNASAAEFLVSLDDSKCRDAPMLVETIPFSENENDLFFLAKSYFDLKEYARCHHFLKDVSHPKLVFLKLYSSLMVLLLFTYSKAIEKKYLQNNAPIPTASTDEAVSLRPDCIELDALSDEVSASLCDDGFLYYLHGIILSKRNHRKEAIKSLVKSLQLYPMNWSAWQSLGELMENWDILEEVEGKLPSCHFKQVFLAQIEMEIPRTTSSSALDYLEPLMKIFPDSPPIQAQVAVSHYHNRDYENAELFFDKLYQKHPFMLDFIDFYSNILYVMEKRPKLSCLSHRAVAIDKYRPETCCVIANYYSSINEHEKAIQYFRRALLLSPSYTQAYTLLGHEYLELKNTSKAIESYHLSTIYNPRDYRAWYGLGQTYQVLRMPIYALYYYGKATERKNGDFRMWSALASVYEDLERWEDSVFCYKRALATGDDCFSLGKLGKLYKELGKYDQAFFYYKLCFGECEVQGIRGDEYEMSCLFLTQWFIEKGDVQQAIKYVEGISHTEEGKSQLKEIQSMRLFSKQYVSK